jgi:hypothetical protein
MRFDADKADSESAFTGRNWPGGVVYYNFDEYVTVSMRNAWRSAAAEWSAVAPVTFVEGFGTGNYIEVISSYGNSSYVGMRGGMQEMYINAWNSKFIIAHEIGHALGLIHEHQRSDRDEYVSIIWNNIIPEQQHNFSMNWGFQSGPYDFESVMHYSRSAFGRGGQNTIEPQPPYAAYLNTMGQTSYLSALDAAGMADVTGRDGMTYSCTVLTFRERRGRSPVTIVALPGKRASRTMGGRVFQSGMRGKLPPVACSSFTLQADSMASSPSTRATASPLSRVSLVQVLATAPASTLWLPQERGIT